MEIAVLLKVVPPADAMRPDPARRTAVREGVALHPNPFDQRALRAALELRRPGERVTVVSLGPPQTGPVLREPLQLGADRVVLLTDPRLAGSDTLATARALVRALQRIGHGLVLAGRSSTDSDTGQVGAEVAGLLGVPVVSAARRVVRDDPGDGLEVVGETEDGSVTYRVEPPAVVTVGEKYGKPLRPDAAQVATTSLRDIEHWSIDDLGLAPGLAGAAGSPTEVVDLDSPAPVRGGRTFDAGSVEERAREAARAISALLGRGEGAVPPVPWLDPGPLADDREGWVLVTGDSGRLDPASLALVAHVRSGLSPLWPSVVWVGPEPSANETSSLLAAGAFRGYRCPADATALDASVAAAAIGTFLDRRPRTAVGMFVSSTFGREVAGQLAARRELGLTGDAVGGRTEAGGTVLWSKPSFGGEVLASIRSRTRPSLATVRPGALVPERPPEVPDALPWTVAEPTPLVASVRRLSRSIEADPEFGDLASARTVVCVGTGVGGPEAVRSLVPLLGRLGAALAATRKVVDAGWVPRHRQVGLTGLHLAPRLALLVGVGGSPNHLVGWRRAGTIVALNADPQAAVFGRCDVGIVGPWRETLAALADELTRTGAAGPP